jgi:hypothetical protein
MLAKTIHISFKRQRNPVVTMVGRQRGREMALATASLKDSDRTPIRP